MDLGVTIFLTDQSIDPVELAREVEARGFTSLWLPEHTHIPTSRRTPPRWASRSTRSTAAASTRSWPWRMIDRGHRAGPRVGTGIALLAERDPIVTAKEVATLDHVSGGRITLGIGYGWNIEELENHGGSKKTRRAVVRERVLAMQELWGEEAASLPRRARPAGRVLGLAQAGADGAGPHRRAGAGRRRRRPDPVRAHRRVRRRLDPRSAAPAWPRPWPTCTPRPRRSAATRASSPSSPSARCPTRASSTTTPRLGIPETVLRLPSARRDEVLRSSTPSSPSSTADATGHAGPGRRCVVVTDPADPLLADFTALNDPPPGDGSSARAATSWSRALLAIERLLALPGWRDPRPRPAPQGGRAAGAGAGRRSTCRSRWPSEEVLRAVVGLRHPPGRAGLGGPPAGPARCRAGRRRAARLLLAAEGVNDHENLGCASSATPPPSASGRAARPHLRRPVLPALGAGLDGPRARGPDRVVRPRSTAPPPPGSPPSRSPPPPTRLRRPRAPRPRPRPRSPCSSAPRDPASPTPRWPPPPTGRDPDGRRRRLAQRGHRRRHRPVPPDG